MKNIILFGPMGAGTSTVARIISDRLGYRIGSLGDKIHDECDIHGKRSRKEMQKYGQMMRGIFGDDVWCIYLHNKLHNHPGRHLEYEKVVIDDGRQQNEYEYWTQKGFVPVGVTAKEHVRRKRVLQRTGTELRIGELTHETEQRARNCVSRCKYVIHNDSDSIDDLEVEVSRIVRMIFSDSEVANDDSY
jgi:dephospho-CoA kinase